MAASKELIDAIAAVWQLDPPEADNPANSPEVARLFQVCKADYPDKDIGSAAGWALSTALRSLGVPAGLPPKLRHLAVPVDDAAQQLDAAFRATSFRRRHIAPLDLADEFPDLDFGAAKVRDYSADELRVVFNETRLKRFYPGREFEAGPLANFRWLVVEDDVPVEHSPAHRNLPILYMIMDQDFGRIVPHEGEFGLALESAIFFLLTAPWEKWNSIPSIGRTGFRVPWTYTVNEDPFVRAEPPPASSTLSWEWRLGTNRYGEEEEYEVPVVMDLKPGFLEELPHWDQAAWQRLEHARTTPLFETPIEHFFTRAMMAEKIDEFIAYMTAIDASIGLHGDYGGTRSTPDPHKGIKVTKRMKYRLVGLLGDVGAWDEYETLFNIRSAYVHGRRMAPISTDEQVLARSLARRVIEALIAAAAGPIGLRETFLDDLLTKGKLLRHP